MITSSKHLVVRRALPGIAIASTVAVGALTPAAGASPHAALAAHGLGCVSSFEATVRQGPGPGSLKGTLTLKTTASGRLSGVLVPRHRRHTGRKVVGLAVYGEIRGNSLTLKVATGVNHMTGTGASARAIKSCKDIPRRGTLTGPKQGDAGDWLISKGPVSCRPGGEVTYITRYVKELAFGGYSEEPPPGTYAAEGTPELVGFGEPGFLGETTAIYRVPVLGLICGLSANFD
jgi:hypothetical protein